MLSSPTGVLQAKKHWSLCVGEESPNCIDGWPIQGVPLLRYDRPWDVFGAFLEISKGRLLFIFLGACVFLLLFLDNRLQAARLLFLLVSGRGLLLLLFRGLRRATAWPAA